MSKRKQPDAGTHGCDCCGGDHVHTYVDRRQTLDMLAAGGLATWLSSVLPGIAQAQQPADEVVRIGYIPITDATAPRSASQLMLASTAAFSTPNLAKKPSIGGTPASENIRSRSAIALPGSRLA